MNDCRFSAGLTDEEIQLAVDRSGTIIEPQQNGHRWTGSQSACNRYATYICALLMRVNKIRLLMSLLFTNFEIQNVSIIEYMNGLRKRNTNFQFERSLNHVSPTAVWLGVHSIPPVCI